MAGLPELIALAASIVLPFVLMPRLVPPHAAFCPCCDDPITLAPASAAQCKRCGLAVVAA